MVSVGGTGEPSLLHENCGAILFRGISRDKLEQDMFSLGEFKIFGTLCASI